jgi:hypothetical protein
MSTLLDVWCRCRSVERQTYAVGTGAYMTSAFNADSFVYNASGAVPSWY